jgi:hypothetical protein
MDGAGLWVRKNMSEKNALEREIATYDTVVFPMRSPEFDEEYRKRDQESKERRKRKLRILRQQQRSEKASTCKQKMGEQDVSPV